MRFKYKITDNNEVKVWDNENPNELNAPFLLQPRWPNGTEWTDKKEAEAWAKVFIEAFSNPESKYVPGNSPEQPKILRPAPVEIDPETNEPELTSDQG